MLEFLGKDLISGGTLASRNMRREKLAAFYFDLGKFAVTGVLFGVVLKLPDYAPLGIGTFLGVGFLFLAVLALTLWLSSLALKELGRLEEPAPK